MQQLSKKFAFALYVPLLIPSILLFVFGFNQKPPEWLFIGLGVGLMIMNALMLVAVYRWLLGMAQDPAVTEEAQKTGTDVAEQAQKTGTAVAEQAQKTGEGSSEE